MNKEMMNGSSGSLIEGNFILYLIQLQIRDEFAVAESIGDED
jgi:hypothetical protein